MSLEIPENMEEVLLKQTSEQNRGRQFTEAEIITKAVLDALQAFVDQETEGHYDSVTWEAETLVVTDIMHEEIGRVQPTEAGFVADFKRDAMGLFFKLEEAAGKIVRGR